MKLSSLSAISILVCIFVGSLSVLSPVSAAPYLVSSNAKMSGYLIDNEHYVVYGEVKNIGDQPATSISFIVDMRDMWAEGGSLGASVGIVLMELNSPIVLGPGESWPWAAHFLDPEAVNVNNQQLEGDISWVVSDALPAGLEIVSQSSDTAGSVDGEVQNIGDAPTTDIEVGATFKDAGGVVLATAFDVIPGPLNPGENATFSIDLSQTDLAPFLGDVLPLIDSYAVTAQSEEYGVIPEFHIWTSMLLILIVLTVALAIYKRRPLKTPKP
jgi:hypothetical protein